jgi:hypothetical protein
MIAYIHTKADDLYRPQIVCDTCLKPITGAGNAYWLVYANGEIHPQIWHTHKLECARLDSVLEHDYGADCLFEELDVWLEQLRNNFTRSLEGIE